MCLLCEEVKQYPVLYDKQMKRYHLPAFFQRFQTKVRTLKVNEIKITTRKKVMNNSWNAGAKDLEFIENSKSNYIIFFMLFLG